MLMKKFYFTRTLILIELQLIRNAIIKISNLQKDISGTALNDLLNKSKLSSMNRYIENLYADVHVCLNNELQTLKD